MRSLKNLTASFKLVAALVLVASVISCSSTLYSLSDWDGNGDNALNQYEFNKVLDDAGYFSLWDADGNGQVSQDEWNQGLALSSMSAPYDADDDGSFNTWDLNNDGTLSKKEVYNGVFNTVDDDQPIDAGFIAGDNEPEPNDNDGLIERDEFDDWYDDDLF